MMNFDVGILISILGVLVFLTNAIVEVIKKAFFVKGEEVLNKLALTVGVLLTVVSYFVYIGYTKSAFIWYYLVGSIVLGFVVALIAMVGWDKILQMWFESQKGDRA